MSFRIPLLRPEIPSLRAAERYLVNCRKTGQFANFGPAVRHAEAVLTERTDKFARLVHSGTDAVQVATEVNARLFGRRDKVILPNFTHFGSFAGATAGGSQAVMVSVGEGWVLTVSRLEDAFLKTGATSAVIVAPFGVIPPVAKIDAWAESRNVSLVYDFAGAWPAVPETKHPICYSLHATKSLPIGEGGIVLFRNEVQWELARRYMNFDLGDDRKAMRLEGGNHKMDDVRAAILLAALEKPQRLVRKLAGRRRFLKRIGELGGKRSFLVPKHYDAPSMVVVRCAEAALTERVLEVTKAANVETRRNYIRLDAMPAFKPPRDEFNFLDNCVALPSDATKEEQEEIIKLLRSVL